MNKLIDRDTMESRNVIKRYGKPGSMDEAPYGTVCKVYNTPRESYDLYIQIHIDPQDPEWERIGTFSITTPQENIDAILNSRLANE